ncbi:hypothetical protein PVK06_014552 [Gossypium arboreum]|uniref:DUF4219 domain-containing protein n=1 Tax=Gossypium arboreum TaxID=29729 RepID=A0ABR0PUV8_GOSAR|nr:hypothetical protein PVK06_014552 [Gossypium arboreum]
MDVEASSSFSSISPPVFDGDNYQVWAVRMEVYMEALDIWEVVEDDYEIPTLPQILPWHRSNCKRRRRQRNPRQRPACSLQSHLLSSLRL